MIYKKNPQTNEIQEFENVNNIGAFFADWTEATQQEIDAFILEQAKQKTKQKITVKRKQEQYETIEYNGKTYYATEIARDNLFMAYVIAEKEKETTLLWFDVDDNEVVLTLDEAWEMILLLREKDYTLYQNAVRALTQIAVATSPEQVNNIGDTYTPATDSETQGGGLNNIV